MASGSVLGASGVGVLVLALDIKANEYSCRKEHSGTTRWPKT